MSLLRDWQASFRICEQTHSTLSLGVYQKNKRAVSFYLREGFSILSEELDEATGETEYTMIWKEKMENN